MLGIAFGTLAHLPAALYKCLVTAYGAEAIAVVPIDLRSGLGNYPRIRPTEGLSSRPCVFESPVPALLYFLYSLTVIRYVDNEIGLLLPQAEKYSACVDSQPRQVIEAEPAKTVM